MLRHISIIAPAKINLYLKVLKHRRGGYHNIVTVFERIDLADKIDIRRTDKGIAISSSVFVTERREDNLAYKAAKAILDFSGSRAGVSMHIDKKIPLASGLGGGSSDAASVLMGTNKLLGLKLSKKKLCELGKGLGADVPFFLSGASFAIGTDRGDNIKPIKSKLSFYHLLICQNFPLSTKKVYEKFDELTGLTNLESGDKIDLASIFRRGDFKPDSILHNDLQEAAISVRKEIRGIIERLAEALARKVIISGSGPSVFCLLKERKEALRARKSIFRSFAPCERENWKIFIVRTL